MCLDQSWGHICDNYMEGNSRTVCTQLGFNGGKFEDIKLFLLDKYSHLILLQAVSTDIIIKGSH